MANLNIQIKSWAGSILFEYESENNTIKKTLQKAVAEKKDLRGADLSGADLSGAFLRGADLRGAFLRGAFLRGADLSGADLSNTDLRGADLSGADLSGADLSGADLRNADLSDTFLRGADLRGADLTPIKQDFFDVLLRAIPELEFLKQNIIEGKIDGTTYDGACSCLSGTLERGAKLHNGRNEGIVIKGIMQCRDSGRPIERFFLSIKTGDTPETNQFSKLALEWLNEFESYISILK